MSDMVCGSCKFLHKELHQMNAFYCKFNPPVPFPINQGGAMGIMSIRPPVKQDDPACGFYRSVTPVTELRPGTFLGD